MSGNANLKVWHEHMKTKSHEGLIAQIADDAVFHSPVVHTPQAGKQLVFAYLSAADQVFGDVFGKQHAEQTFDPEKGDHKIGHPDKQNCKETATDQVGIEITYQPGIITQCSVRSARNQKPGTNQSDRIHCDKYPDARIIGCSE